MQYSCNDIKRRKKKDRFLDSWECYVGYMLVGESGMARVSEWSESEWMRNPRASTVG